MYKQLIRPLLFLADAEWVHNFSFGVLRFLLSMAWVRRIFMNSYQLHTPSLEQELWGLTFKNPIGLAAGFDKDAKLGTWWEVFGFGFVEFGTVTPRPQEGNPKPRLFRLLADQGIINRMGFNNQGLKKLRVKLKALKRTDLIIGANIGKNKATSDEEAVKDYIAGFETLYEFVDYFVVNVSSPNTPGLRKLQEKEPLMEILRNLQVRNQAKPKQKPLLLKIAPDLTTEQLDDIVEVAQAVSLDGIIATNTTISREGLQTPEEQVAAMGAGGLSGKPLYDRAEEVLRYLHQKTAGKLTLIGVGGIFTGEQVQQRLDAGASLVQIYSGFVYEGPAMVKKLLQYLLQHTEK